MLAVGSSRRTLRKPQALKGALRQFASVTSRSGAGGKSSIRAAVICPQSVCASGSSSAFAGQGTLITFQRALSRIDRRVDKNKAAYQRFLAEKRFARWNKRPLLPRRHS
jgi:hypothetical protein